MYNMVLENNAVQMASVFLPADYSTDKKFPALLWIVGGMGSTGDGASALAETYGNKGVIFINLPQFKSKIEPLLPDRSNFWRRLLLTSETDNEIIWKSYKTMLDSIWSIVPNIDPTNSVMYGFSNGAHTKAILLNRPNAEITIKYEPFNEQKSYKILRDNVL